MKKIFKLFVPMTAAVIALAACNRDNQVKAPSVPALHIVVNAVVEDSPAEDPDSKTYVDVTDDPNHDGKYLYSVYWGTDEYMKIGVYDGSATTWGNSSDDNKDDNDGEAEATFTFDITPSTASGDYTYYGFYPKSAAIEATSNYTPSSTAYRIKLPQTQNATSDSYDPAAYILVAQPESGKSAANAGWEAKFRRATALNKITLKNIPSGVSIKRVKITASEGNYLSADRLFNLTTGASGDFVANTNRSESVEVKYATPLAGGANMDIWFTSWGVDLVAGNTLTIVAFTTDKKSYTKTITLAGDQKISFTEGKVNTLGANMSGITPGDVTELDEGDYVVLAKKTASPVAYYALKAELSNTRMAYVDYSGDISVNDGSDASIIWHLTKSGDSYIFENDSKYLGVNEVKTASWAAAGESWTEDAYLLDVTAQSGDNVGMYHVTNHTNSGWYLSKNSNSGWFAFYANTNQYANIIFVPVDTRNPAPISWSAATGTATITSSGTNYSLPSLVNSNSLAVTYSSSDETVATVDEDNGTVTAVAAGTANIIATYDGSAANAPYRTTAVSYELTVTDQTVSYDFETVAELNGLVTSTSDSYKGYLTDAVVSFVPNTGTAIVKDATGSVMIYKSSHGLLQGQTYTGEITVTAIKYNSLYSEITAWSGATFTGSQAAVAPEDVSLADLTGHFDDYQNAYVQVTGLTVVSISSKNINVTDGTNNYVVYYNPSGTIPCEADDVITAVGTVTKYNATEEIKVWASSAITVTGSAPKAITFSQPASGGSFTVTVGGNAITSGDTVASGTTVTLTATPATNYAFGGWTVSGATVADASAATTTFTMGTSTVTVSAAFLTNSAVTLTALSSEETTAGCSYSVSVDNSPISSGTNVLEGKSVVLSATAGTGYTFSSWSVYKTGDTSTTVTVSNNSFTMPAYPVTICASFTSSGSSSTTTLTNANIVAAGDASSGYTSWAPEDDNGNVYNSYAIKNKHSNATSSYHYLQIKKYASNTAYYVQIPQLGTKITSITMTVSSTQQPMTGGGNSATLFFSASSSTSAAGTGVASGTGASSVTIDCSALNLNTGYITASGAVRIWDIAVTYN